MRGAGDDDAVTAARWAHVGGWLLGVLCSIAVTGSVTGAGTQQLGENDTAPPTWDDATKSGPDEIGLAFTDNGTIDRETVSTGDFTVSAGNRSNVSVESADEGVAVVFSLRTGSTWTTSSWALPGRAVSPTPKGTSCRTARKR